MGGHDARTYREGRELVLLWLAVLSGPAAWTLNLLVGYALVKPVCANRSSLTLPLLSAVALVMSLGGAWLAWACLAKLRGSSHFVALTSIWLNLLIALLIVTAAVAPFLLSPCE
jgi:hypothetical protein